MRTSLDEIVANFDLLEEWDDRYRYLIELGKGLDPLPEEAHSEANKVRGCASQVWLESQAEAGPGPQTRLSFRGDSDAHIVRGLVALTLAIYSGRTAAEIIATDAFATYEKLGLAAHLTPQRSNGVRSMIERIKSDARAAAAG
ncbi:MAG TPA: SufE family protein [Bosea sp. (in: a-proteobacteria)]|jgi:cysteine desulfuration protein SufE|uniref:SufE family protein n=1 Tax=Bosea sp. (in: a-proteobacteria) TaxID=1871050 RepID=UPI002DDCF258|nr:SufE family protein [Bosea sp. (in: a-proteobacteria)]HEV2553815.1 SufE family protein [Bosea sp. (in: a-proteobacteria)]